MLELCVRVLSHSVVSDSLRPHGLQPTRLLCPWGFSRQEHWSGWPCPPLGHLPNPGIKPSLPHCRRICYHLSHQGSPLELYRCVYIYTYMCVCVCIYLFISIYISAFFSQGTGKYNDMFGKIWRLWDKHFCFFPLKLKSSLSSISTEKDLGDYQILTLCFSDE